MKAICVQTDPTHTLNLLRKPAYLAVAVLDDHQHRGVLALHGPVQRLNAHAVLRGAESQRPRVADRPWREILGELKACVEKGKERREKKGKSKTASLQQPTLNYICSDLLTSSGV